MEMKTILLLDSEYKKSDRYNEQAFTKLLKKLKEKNIDYDLHIKEYITSCSPNYRPSLPRPHSFFGFKLELFYEILKDYPDDQVILYTDSFDTYFLADQEEILNKFKSFNADIVFGHEKNCWPNLKDEPKFYPNGDFINAGVYIGINSKIRKLMEYCIHLNHLRFYDDQHAFLILTKLMREGIKVEVDLNCELVFNLDVNVLNQYTKSNDRIVNVNTNIKPCILHANGGTYEKMMSYEIIKSVWI